MKRIFLFLLCIASIAPALYAQDWTPTRIAAITTIFRSHGGPGSAEIVKCYLNDGTVRTAEALPGPAERDTH